VREASRWRIVVNSTWTRPTSTLNVAGRTPSWKTSGGVGTFSVETVSELVHMPIDAGGRKLHRAGGPVLQCYMGSVVLLEEGSEKRTRTMEACSSWEAENRV
jgi:hypothetical protein